MKQPTFLNVLKDEIKKYNTHHGADGKFDYCDGSCGSGGGGGSKGGKASGGSKASGSSSGSGGAGSRAVNTERRGQLGVQKKPFDTVAKECGVGLAEANAMGSAVNRFTNSDYIDIRRSQNGKMSSDDPKYAKSKQDANLIEEYIKLAPKYDGAIYRGVQSSSDRLKVLKKGAIIDMNGVSSWSSEVSVAKDFSTTFDTSKRSVVFRLPKTNSGTAISHLSSLPQEYEVIMSQQASFKITKVTKEKYVTYIDLTEVTSITKSLEALLHGGEVAKAGAGVKMKLVDRWLSDDDGFRIVSEEAEDVEKSNPHRGADGKFTNCDGSCGNGSGAAASSHGGTGAPDNNAGSGGKKNPGRIITTPHGLEIIQNPTNEEYRQLHNEVSEKYPFLGPGEPRIRHTYDMDGNEYIWNAYEGIHTAVQPYINEAYGTKTDQHHKWWEKDEWREYVLNKSYDDDGESNEFTIMKSDEDKRLVFGWGSVAIDANGEQLVDYQGDMIDPDVIEEAAYEYVLNFRDTGEEHIPSMRKKGKLVESVVFTKEKQAAMGIPEGILPVGWWVGFKIHDDRAWEMVKSGKYRMFSIEGRAERIPVEKKRTFLECIEKYNHNHDPQTGRFTHGPGGPKGAGKVSADKYKELYPKDSYINSPTYKKLGETLRDSWKESREAYDRKKELEEQLKGYKKVDKPRDQWTFDDEVDYEVFDITPKMYEGDGEKIKAQIEEETRKIIEAGSKQDVASNSMHEIKERAHREQMADVSFDKPKKANQDSYKGFKSDDTGVSYYNDLMDSKIADKKGLKTYIAEMSPKEYIQRCAYEIFEGGTMESTLGAVDRDNLAKYTKMMQDGAKFDMPYLNYADSGQEGRHRALAAYNNGIDTIPVLIVENNTAKGNSHRGPDGRFVECDGSCTEGNSMIRQGPPPKKTKIAYKVFCVKNGKLYPPMVANPDAQDTPVGVWLDAQEGVKATNPDGTPVTNTLGRFKVKAGGKGTKGGGGTLAYRPGWHLGELPVADQFYTKNKKTGVKEQYPNFVWAECEIAADIDYQAEAMSYGYTKNGKFLNSLAGLPKIPVDGCYKYRTNPDPNTKPWYITGAMKVNRILTDAETNKILRENGIEPMPRKGGELDLEALGITERDFTVNKSSSFLEILKYNEYHDPRTGRFTYAPGGGAKGGISGAAGSKRNYGETNLGDAVPGDCLSSHIGSDGKLTPEREELHKQIIDKFLEGKTPATGTPQLTMMGGGPASGKSTMIKEGFVKDPDISSDTIKIDPDAIKAELPEYKSMVEAGDKSASAFVHEESSALAKRLYSVALNEGINVTYDGTGDGSVKSVIKKVNAAKSQGYEIVGEYATCDIDEAIRRADARGKQTGRYVDHGYLKACHAKVTDIAYECSPQFDKINVYDTSGDIKLIATGGKGKHLTAVDTAGFNSFMSKGTNFITLPNGQVVPVEE